MSLLNAFTLQLSRRHRRLLLVWCLVPIIAAVVWLQNGRHSDDFVKHVVYSFAIATLTWAFIDLGRWPARRWLGLQDSNDWPSPLRAALWVVGGVVFGYVAGTAVGDTYAGHSTWALLALNDQRFWSIIASSLMLALGFTAYFWQQGRAEHLARKASEVQLRLLQSQLDPHMMFNTLATLRALIGSDPVRATEMLDRFNDYLRSSLSANLAPTHSLAQEFEHLRAYLDVMRMRMSERLRVVLDLPEALRNLTIPSLLLQPLVENAVRHGLEPQVEGGTITVRAQTLPDGATLISVEDDGMGCLIPPQAGFGLSSVRERVAAHFGSQAHVYIHSSPEAVRIELRLPKP